MLLGRSSSSLKKRLEAGKGIRLDIGCGPNKEPGTFGIDVRPLDGVDLVHDIEDLPWPLPDECALSCLASHILEHINPCKFGFIKVMDEIWRVLKPRCRLMAVVPYGRSQGYLQDPSHCNPVIEITLAYFAPEHESGLYNIYQPRPWRIIANVYHSNGNLEFILEKMPDSRVEPLWYNQVRERSNHGNRKSRARAAERAGANSRAKATSRKRAENIH